MAEWTHFFSLSFHDSNIQTRLMFLQDEMVKKCSLLGPYRVMGKKLHLTLAVVNIRPGKECHLMKIVKDVIQAILKDIDFRTVTFSHMFRPDPEVLAVAMKDDAQFLSKLLTAIKEAFKENGFGSDFDVSIPHVTLFRFKDDNGLVISNGLSMNTLVESTFAVRNPIMVQLCRFGKLPQGENRVVATMEMGADNQWKAFDSDEVAKLFSTHVTFIM